MALTTPYFVYSKGNLSGFFLALPQLYVSSNISTTVERDIKEYADERTPCDQGTLQWEDTLWSGDTPMRGNPVIRGHSDERTPCDQGTLRWEDTMWSGDTPMRGHPVVRGHSDERTPCDQGTLRWEDTLWSGDTPMRGHPVIRGHSDERTLYIPILEDVIESYSLYFGHIRQSILSSVAGTEAT